jgi:hypothetical protein
MTKEMKEQKDLERREVILFVANDAQRSLKMIFVRWHTGRRYDFYTATIKDGDPITEWAREWIIEDRVNEVAMSSR